MQFMIAPGRIRELIREKYLSTSHIRSIVLDEADTLLNFQDNPQVEWLLDGMKEDYQLVLASATINTRVEKFVGEVMELEVGEEGYVVVDGDDADAFDDGEIDVMEYQPWVEHRSMAMMEKCTLIPMESRFLHQKIHPTKSL